MKILIIVYYSTDNTTIILQTIISITVMTTTKKKSGKSDKAAKKTAAASAAITKSSTPELKIEDLDAHPLQNGHCGVVKFRDGSLRLAKLLSRNEIKASSDHPTGNWQYYVHYHEFNRRMDEWITIDKIVTYPSKANAAIPRAYRIWCPHLLPLGWCLDI